MKRTIEAWAVLALCALSSGGCAGDPEPGTEGDGTRGSTMGTGGTASPRPMGATTGPSGSPTGSSGSTTTPAAGSGSTEPGTGTSGGSAGDNVDCMAQPLPSNPDDVISTFEDGTGNVNQSAGRGGAFYMFNDGTSGAMQTPAPGALPDAREESRCDGLFALCMAGSGFTVWGAGMGTDLAPTTAGMGMGDKQTYDASMYTGIAFWAKAASTLALRVSIKDKNTAPEGGTCDPMIESGATACNDDWGKGISLSTEWKPYTVTFAELRQAGWGQAFPAFDAAAAYSIQFQVNKGVAFDMCIDDLVFVR
jgi:hypothetical protein